MRIGYFLLTNFAVLKATTGAMMQDKNNATAHITTSDGEKSSEIQSFASCSEPNARNPMNKKYLLITTILLLLSIPAHAQTLVASTSAAWYQPSPSLTVPAGQNLACVVDAHIQGGSGAPTLSDSTTDHWTLATQVGDAVLQAAWYAVPCSPGVHVLNVSRATTAPAYRFVNALAYSGVGIFDAAATATGQSALASTSLNTAQAGELLVASFTENGPLSPTEVLDASYIPRLSTYFEQLVSADKVAGAAGAYSSSLTFQPPFTSTPNWTAILLAFKPPGPPPQPDSITASAQLLWCAKCDGSDNVPAVGNLLISQTGAGDFSTAIAPDGTVKALGTIDISQDWLEFTLSLTDVNGAVQPGASLKLTFPKFEINSPSFVLGNVTLGIVRITHITDAAGNPAVRIVDFGPFSLAK